ncbi:hypothetical protein ACWEJ7_31035 [Streptomyces albidoflavus]
MASSAGRAVFWPSARFCARLQDGLNRRPGCPLPSLVSTCGAVCAAHGGLNRRPGLVVAGLRLDLLTVTVPVTDGLNRRPSCFLLGSVPTWTSGLVAVAHGGLSRRPGLAVAGLRSDVPTVTGPVTDGLNRRPGCFLLGSVLTWTSGLVAVAQGGLSRRPG